MLLWFIFLLSIFIHFLNIEISNCYGDSPIYSRIDIRDNVGDWNVIDRGSGKNDETLKNLGEFISFNDISSMNYISDGKTMNVTFWLKQPFEELPTVNFPIYTLYIDVDANPSTGGSVGVDYRIQVFWNDNTQRWEKIIEEVSAGEFTKILSKDDNFSNFYPDNDEYYYQNIKQKWFYDPCCFITYSIDLKLLNYPPHYLMWSSVTIPLEDNFFIQDPTYYVEIPQPEIQIVSKENPVSLRKDETKTIPIQINSTSFLETQLNLTTPRATDKTEDITISPKVITLSPYGSSNAFLTITSRLGDQSDINSARDEITVTAKGSTFHPATEITPINKEIYQLVELKNYPFSEWLNDKLKELGILWKDNTEFMLLIIGIFLTPIGAWIVDKATKRKRKNA